MNDERKAEEDGEKGDADAAGNELAAAAAEAEAADAAAPSPLARLLCVLVVVPSSVVRLCRVMKRSMMADADGCCPLAMAAVALCCCSALLRRWARLAREFEAGE